MEMSIERPFQATSYKLQFFRTDRFSGLTFPTRTYKVKRLDHFAGINCSSLKKNVSRSLTKALGAIVRQFLESTLSAGYHCTPLTWRRIYSFCPLSTVLGKWAGEGFRTNKIGQWTVDSGQWTVDSGQWTVDSGQWTVDSGQWTVDSGQWTVDSGQWTVDSGQWTVDSGQWTVDSG